MVQERAEGIEVMKGREGERSEGGDAEREREGRINERETGSCVLNW